MKKIGSNSDLTQLALEVIRKKKKKGILSKLLGEIDINLSLLTKCSKNGVSLNRDSEGKINIDINDGSFTNLNLKVGFDDKNFESNTNPGVGSGVIVPNNQYRDNINNDRMISTNSNDLSNVVSVQ